MTSPKQLLSRRSRPQRVLETVKSSLHVPSGVKSSLSSVGSSKAMKAGLITVGGLAGLTAGSAGLASLRRRSEGANDDS
jgi:hypothetical protein